MFRAKTLFIVGAGASAEAELPVGSALATKIAGALNFTTEFGQLKSGDEYLYQALKRQCASGDFGEYLRACRLIRDGIRLVRSIDNFISAHREDPIVATCGKIAIAHEMLKAEGQSLLRMRAGRQGERVDLDSVENTWYAHFGQMLASDLSTSDLSRVLENVAVISFNYDRIIEHFLAHWLARLSGCELRLAEAAVAELEVIRPYGSIGPTTGNHAVPYGCDASRRDIPAISRNIKTYSEQVEDEQLLGAIQQHVTRSETVVFLGFHFHEPNMRLLKPTGPTQVKRIFATAMGFSEADCESFTGMLASAFRASASEAC